MNRKRIRDRALSWLCLTLVPLIMAPEEPEKLSLGGTGYRAGLVIEERDGSDTTTREIVYAGGTALWQILGDGTSQYFHEDPRGNVVMLTEGAGLPTAAAGDVLERVTYDPYGKPIFQDAANQNKTEAGGPLLAKSDFHNTLLYMGRWYDPETGSRGTAPGNDRGGLYDFRGRFLNPDEGRFITRTAEGHPDRPVIAGRYAFAGHAPVSRSVQHGQSDLAFLTRAAGGPMPQTREHILLARQVGVPRIPGHTQEWGDYNASGNANRDSFAFGVEREMKESGEKGGTEDINIGVGELQECDGEFWFEDLAPGAAGQASDDHGEFWFLDVQPGVTPLRAKHRMFVIIDRSIPTSGKDDGSSCWIRVPQTQTSGRVVVKGKHILEN